ncbi:MAG: hypothetical protein LBD51_03110 [Bifidobacteriaceae bacterium]|nr:hypothetical protein [Bifidobacteriaceae bacterium]
MIALALLLAWLLMSAGVVGKFQSNPPACNYPGEVAADFANEDWDPQAHRELPTDAQAKCGESAATAA